MGLAGKVGFTGFLEDTPAAMRSLDVIVHASTAPEPFGMVIIEGMACGKAVIASQAGGAAELFIDGEDALAHRPGDAAALARQIQRLASDGQLRRRLGDGGRARCRAAFRWRTPGQGTAGRLPGRPVAAHPADAAQLRCSRPLLPAVNDR